MMAINSSSLGQNGHHFADIFKCIFLNDSIRIAIKISQKFVSVGSDWQEVSIGSGNGLAPNRQQAITWTNADPVHWCIYIYIYVGLGGDELNTLRLAKWLTFTDNFFWQFAERKCWYFNSNFIEDFLRVWSSINSFDNGFTKFTLLVQALAWHQSTHMRHPRVHPQRVKYGVGFVS